MQSVNPFELWQNMGLLARLVVVVLGSMSVYSLWVLFDRFMVLSKARRYSVAFVLALRERLDKHDLNGASTLAKSHAQSPIAKLVGAALIEYRDGLDATTKHGREALMEFDLVEAVERAIERVKEREVAGLRKGLGGLASIASAAPFIGLFGTVVGIINAFRSMAVSGQGGLGAVSSGIAEALFTTAVGLLVAIPAVMGFNYFSGLVDELGVDMNDVGAELTTYILREGRGAGR